jgi:hypothetical protein
MPSMDFWQAMASEASQTTRYLPDRSIRRPARSSSGMARYATGSISTCFPSVRSPRGGGPRGAGLRAHVSFLSWVPEPSRSFAIGTEQTACQRRSQCGIPRTCTPWELLAARQFAPHHDSRPSTAARARCSATNQTCCSLSGSALDAKCRVVAKCRAALPQSRIRAGDDVGLPPPAAARRWPQAGQRDRPAGTPGERRPGALRAAVSFL